MERLVRSIEARLLESLAEARRRRDYDAALTLAFAIEENRRAATSAKPLNISREAAKFSSRVAHPEAL